MAKSPATYDANLSTDKDWVRLNIGDRNIKKAIFSDAEINATLTEAANKWIAAANLIELILSERKGAVSRSVEDLSISYGDSPTSSYRAHGQRLREYGCTQLLKKTGGSILRPL